MLRKLFKRFNQSNNQFENSSKYWEDRYKSGGNSGLGSYAEFAEFKSKVLNQFLEEYQIQTVIEFGCGDGNQLKYINYPKYIGTDVSSTTIQNCSKLFKDDQNKSFLTMEQYKNQRAELALSLDVIYHLVEDDVFSDYMDKLFKAASNYVCIFSTNTNRNNHTSAHIKHRNVIDYISLNFKQWSLFKTVKNQRNSPDYADFFFYQKIGN